MKDNFDFTIQSLDQLDYYQQFTNEYGTCMVVGVFDNPDFSAIQGYEYEVIEANEQNTDKQGSIYILEIGEIIRLN
jgi:hypothetical protein